jgi:hypothetical protein
MEAHAFAMFPGGFGTHDESFETLTLIQTGKAPPMPIILVELPGEDYWESWDHFIKHQMLRRGLISPEDLALYRIVHSPEEGVEWICRFYATYHSMRRVRNRLVLRLERELTAEQMAELNESYADLVREGNISKTGPARVEEDEPELQAKPRISFNYTGRSAGRLTQLIWRICDMGQELEQAA